MANIPSQSVHRKTLAIKRNDAEPLTREDIQYDLLNHIFNDDHAVFTDPYSTLNNETHTAKVTFRDLYVNALVNSPRSSKVLREKIVDTPQFGTDFAMISLLANVGRINTTMAFFPEMRTALRTYHPVPSLQKTDGNLQDAPRIKNALKACLLKDESKGAPSTPMDVVLKRDSGHVPSTSVVNLVFVLSNHALTVARDHFDSNLDFLDLFLPIDVPSEARSQAFLWLCFHYLEPSSIPNPFADDYSRRNPRKAPALLRRTGDGGEPENVDTAEERAWGEKMAEQRRNFVRKTNEELLHPSADSASTPPPEKKGKERTSGRTKGSNPKPAELERQALSRRVIAGEKIPRCDSRPPKETLSHKSSQQKINRDVKQKHTPVDGNPHHTLFDSSGKAMGLRQPIGRPGIQYSVMPPTPERTMLEHAWHIVTTTDPLMDSDDEIADEHVRLDYTRRLQTLNRLRGKSPTPDIELPTSLQPDSNAMEQDPSPWGQT
ncbi:hypothetical protein BD410DRAFT_780848 [Rickenella mellea]|uniref:Ino eighty subunit 1 n=1 Tax=Rickenella mellea TaxID=50990 RepID=A0A4Y7QMR8_9AGAM|nr:hypothetical protein BD410DRAFT_780848 [Rickenella mellea]